MIKVSILRIQSVLRAALPHGVASSQNSLPAASRANLMLMTEIMQNTPLNTRRTFCSIYKAACEQLRAPALWIGRSRTIDSAGQTLILAVTTTNKADSRATREVSSLPYAPVRQQPDKLVELLRMRRGATRIFYRRRRA